MLHITNTGKCKEGKMLNEAKFKIMAPRLKAMTEINDHGECYRVIANFLGYTDLEEKFADINRTQERVGYLDMNVSNERYALYCEMRERGIIDHGDWYMKYINANT